VTVTAENGSTSGLFDGDEDTLGQFKSWGSTPRFHKGLHITEKLDGTNACVIIYNGEVKAQSRKRIITPDNDNFGFAKWVEENKEGLKNTLGYGYHYGEWYGEGIQNNPLGVDGRWFALFNTWHWKNRVKELIAVPRLTTVPILHDEEWHGPADYMTIPNILNELRANGSRACGYETHRLAQKMDVFRPIPEGIIVWQRETRQRYKILLQEDDKHKWEVAQAKRAS
jgi:hypothetical protein